MQGAITFIASAATPRLTLWLIGPTPLRRASDSALPAHHPLRLAKLLINALSSHFETFLVTRCCSSSTSKAKHLDRPGGAKTFLSFWTEWCPLTVWKAAQPWAMPHMFWLLNAGAANEWSSPQHAGHKCHGLQLSADRQSHTTHLYALVLCLLLSTAVFLPHLTDLTRDCPTHGFL